MGLKKKYYIESNIFEPVKAKKIETESLISFESKIHDYLTSFNNKTEQPSFSSKDIGKKNLASQPKFEKTKESVRSPVNIKNYTSLEQ